MSNDRALGKTWSASDRFNVSSDALVRTFKGDRLAVVHMKTKRTHVLNSTAAEIWKLLAAGSSRGEVQEALARTYSVDQNQLSTEINQILDMLSGEDLIHLQD